MPQALSDVWSSFAVKAAGGTLLFIVALGYLAVGFVQDLGRVKRGEPLNNRYGQPVYPGDLSYNYIRLRRLIPAIAAFIVVGLIALSLLAAVIYSAFRAL